MRKKKLYFISTGKYVGNDVLWWGINSKGYTCNLAKAGRYSKKEAVEICSNKGRLDQAWPVKHVLINSIKVADMQYLDAKQILI